MNTTTSSSTPLSSSSSSKARKDEEMKGEAAEDEDREKENVERELEDARREAKQIGKDVMKRVLSNLKGDATIKKAKTVCVDIADAVTETVVDLKKDTKEEIKKKKNFEKILLELKDCVKKDAQLHDSLEDICRNAGTLSSKCADMYETMSNLTTLKEKLVEAATATTTKSSSSSSIYASFLKKIKETEDGEDVEEEVMAMDGELSVLDMRCPMTQQPFVDPWKNTQKGVCEHSFEKVPIEAYIKKGKTKCPVTGCKGVLSLKALEKNTELLKQIEKEKRKRGLMGETSSKKKPAYEVSDDDDDEVI